MLDNVLVFDKRKRNFASLATGRDIQTLNFFSLKLCRRQRGPACLPARNIFLHKRYKMNESLDTLLFLIVFISDIFGGNWRIIRHIYINDYNVYSGNILGGKLDRDINFIETKAHVRSDTESIFILRIQPESEQFFCHIFFLDAGDRDCFRFRKTLGITMRQIAWRHLHQQCREYCTLTGWDCFIYLWQGDLEGGRNWL